QCAGPPNHLTLALHDALPILWLTAIAAFADNWPQWRGPNNNGATTETAFPISWSATSNVLWRAELPEPGNSSPKAHWTLRSMKRSEEHTSELQSQSNLVCRLL